MWRHLQRAGFGRAPQTGVRAKARATAVPAVLATDRKGHHELRLRPFSQPCTAGPCTQCLPTKGALCGRDSVQEWWGFSSNAGLLPRDYRLVLPMLEKATSKEGCGAVVAGARISVAGKTGTQKNWQAPFTQTADMSHRLSDLAPVSNPRYVVAVMIDEPAGGIFYGGQVAAPVFSSIMGQTLRLMEVPYDALLPGQPSVVDTGGDRARGRP